MNGSKVNYLTYQFDNKGKIEKCIPQIEKENEEKLPFYKNRKMIFSDNCKQGCCFYDGKYIKDINGNIKTQIKTNVDELMINFCQLNNVAEYIFLKTQKIEKSHRKKKFIYSILKSQNNSIKDSIFLGSSDPIKNIGMYYPFLFYFVINEEGKVFLHYQTLQNR